MCRYLLQRGEEGESAHSSLCLIARGWSCPGCLWFIRASLASLHVLQLAQLQQHAHLPRLSDKSRGQKTAQDPSAAPLWECCDVGKAKEKAWELCCCWELAWQNTPPPPCCLGAAQIKAQFATAQRFWVWSCRGGWFLHGQHTRDQLPSSVFLIPAKELMD